MFKKAGIVVGITLFLIAGVLFWFVNKSGKDEEPSQKQGVTQQTEQQSPPQQNEIITEQPTQTQPITEQPNQGQQGQEIPSNQTQTTPVTPVQTQSKVFSELDEADLGNPIISRTEVMTVSKKKVVLMDSNYGTDVGKQLAYAVDLLYGEETMTLFLNGSVYQTLQVGARLKVDYNIHKNSTGVSFPVITNVEVAQ